jgi:predicted cupin superfamily sugar epimerase
MSRRAAELIAALKLQPHPEGGHYREIFRSPCAVRPETPGDGRPTRSALTSIDFLLRRGEFSAWHRVASDEAWHLLEGGPLRLWVMSPAGDRVEAIVLAPVGETRAPRHVVPAGAWQAAEPLGDFAYCAATVAPGFEFADFSFLRDAPAERGRLQALDASLTRLL